MVQFHPQILLTLALTAFALYLLCRRFDPQQRHGRILNHCVAGVLMLALWNLLLPLPLGVNPFSSWIAGSLGLPGLGLLAVLALMG